jgi:hypothetical protein
MTYLPRIRGKAIVANVPPHRCITRRFTVMLKRFGMLLAVCTLMVGIARAENTVWISASTPTLKVSKSGSTYRFETAKSSWYVKQGDRLPAHLQTEAGKVLRAGVKPATKGGKR